MTVTHLLGPVVSTSSDGPDLSWGGSGLLDPRQGYQNGQDWTVPILGWTGNTMLVMDAAPAQLGTATLAALQVPTANTPLNLVTTSSAAVTVGASVVNTTTGQLVTGLLAIDGLPAVILCKPLQPIQIYDPRKAVSRAVSITSAGNDSTATFTVRGYGLYGQPMSEVITGANIGLASGKKAFKYIASVTPAGTLSGANVSVGTLDIIGFPLYVPGWELVDIYYGTPPTPAFITVTTGFLAGSTATPTGTTGDTRGTYALQSASDGTKTVTMYITIPPWNLAADVNGVFSGIFGVNHFSN